MDNLDLWPANQTPSQLKAHSGFLQYDELKTMLTLTMFKCLKGVDILCNMN